MGVKEIFVVMNFSVMAWKSLGLKWTTEALHASCCEGEDKMLMWNCSLEKNETVQNRMWFFQSTQIADVSESGKFDVHNLYKCRLEQIGKMGILLKNVSSIDTGNYSLHLNLGPHPPDNMQTIFLTVLESPTYWCKPSITKDSENNLFCSTNSCGEKQLSTEWRISENYDFVSKETSLKINSSWDTKLISCCLPQKNIQCQNVNFLDICTSTFIFVAEDKHAPDSKYTENYMNLIPAVLATTATLLSITVICFIRRRCSELHMDERVCFKEHEDRSAMGGTKQCKDTDKEKEPKIESENAPIIEERSDNAETDIVIQYHNDI